MVAPLTERQADVLDISPQQGSLRLLDDMVDTGPNAPIWGPSTDLFVDTAAAPSAVISTEAETSGLDESIEDLRQTEPDLYAILKRIETSNSSDALPMPPKVANYDVAVSWADTPVEEAEEPEIVQHDAKVVSKSLLPAATGSAEISRKERSTVIKLFGGAVRVAQRVAKGVANRLSDVLAARNETSHQLNRRTTAVITASALLLGAAGYVYSPNNHTASTKTEQAAPANPEQELALLRSHLPKTETAPSGAWVPPSIKVWEESVNKLLHAKELEPYNLLVDPQLILAIMTPSSLGDPNAKGHNGREGLMQIPKEEGDPQYMKGYDPLSPRDSIVVGILDVDHRMKIALAAKDYSNDRAGLIRAIIEGPEPGMGYEPVPAYAKALADRVIQLDANWSKPTNDDYSKWVADTSVGSLLNQAVNNLLDQGLLVRKK